MHESIKFYDTVRLARSDKLALKTPKFLYKKAFFVDFAIFFRTIDGLLRCVNKFGLPTVFVPWRYCVKPERSMSVFDRL